MTLKLECEPKSIEASVRVSIDPRMEVSMSYSCLVSDGLLLSTPDRLIWCLPVSSDRSWVIAILVDIMTLPRNDEQLNPGHVDHIANLGGIARISAYYIIVTVRVLLVLLLFR